MTDTRIKDLTAVNVPDVGASVVVDDAIVGTRRVALRSIDTLLPPGWFIAQLGFTPAANERVVRASGWDGTDAVPVVTLALATQAYVTKEPLYTLIGAVDGGSMTSGVLVICGRVALQAASISGALLNGNVYVSDTGHYAATPGTHTRVIGKNVSVGVGDPAPVVVAFDGQFAGAAAVPLTADVVVGNSVAGDDASTCDYLDAGDGVQLIAALAAAAAASPPKSVGVRRGTYNLAAGAGAGPFTVASGVRMIALGAVTLAGKVSAADQTVLLVQSGGLVGEGVTVKVNSPTGIGTGTTAGYAVIQNGGVAVGLTVSFAAFAAGFTAKLGPKACGLSVCRGAAAYRCTVSGAPSVTQDTGSPGLFAGIGYGADAGASTGGGLIAACRAIPSGGQMPDAQLAVLASGGKIDVQTVDGYLLAVLISTATADLVDTDLTVHGTFTGAATGGIGRDAVYISASGGFGIKNTRIRGTFDPNDNATAGTTMLQVEASGASSNVTHLHVSLSGGTWEYGAYLKPTAPATIDDVDLRECDFSQVRTSVLSPSGTGSTRVRLPRREVISPASLSTSQNDWAPTGLDSAGRIRVTASTPVNLTGLLAQEDGALIELECLAGSSTITIKSASASSAVGNRFGTGGTDIALIAGYALLFRYDVTSGIWRAVRQPTTTSTTPQKVGGTSSGGTAGGLGAPVDHAHEIGFGSDARGDLPVRGASAYGRLALGAAGTGLRSDGTDAVWGYLKTATKTGTSYTIALVDEMLFVDTSGGNYTLTVPATVPGAGWRCRIQKKTTDANTITLARGSFTGKIQGAAADFAWALSSSPGYPWIDLVSDGTDLWVQ